MKKNIIYIGINMVKNGGGDLKKYCEIEETVTKIKIK